MLNTQRIQVGIRTPNITEKVGSWSDVFLNNWNQGFFCSVFHTVHDKCIGPSSTILDIHIFAPCGCPQWYFVVRPNRLWCISTLPESTMCGRLRCTSSLKSSRMKEAHSTPDFGYEIPAFLLASGSITPSTYCLINNISCIVKYANSTTTKKVWEESIFELKFHAPLQQSTTS